MRIALPATLGFFAAGTCCCCDGIFERLGIGSRTEAEVVAPAPEPVKAPAPAKKAAVVDDGRLLKGDLATFPDFPESELKSFANMQTLTSATLMVDDVHKPVEVVEFYKKAALDKGYFIDSEVAKGPQPSFQAIRGNVSFRVVAQDLGEQVQYSLTTERTL